MEIKNILIIKPSAMGDIVQSFPVLRTLRENFGDAKISWLVRKEFAGLFEGVSDLDEVIVFDRKYLGRWWYDPKAAKALWRFLMKLRGHNFDLAFDLQGLFRSGFFSWAGGCKRRFGMKNAREFATLFYTDSAGLPDGSFHVLDHYMELLKLSGVSRLVYRYDLFPEEGAQQRADAILSANSVSKRFAVLITGSARPEKFWPLIKFAEIAKRLNKQFGLDIVTVGSKSEYARNEELASICECPLVNLAGRTSISELSGVLRRGSISISNDTGPGYISAALSRPTVLVFGNTNPCRVMPYGRMDMVAAVDVFGRGKAISNNDKRYNVENVTVEMVMEKVSAQLKAEAGGGSESANC